MKPSFSSCRDFLTRLNGWQRLWFFTLALWFVPVAVFTVRTLPSREAAKIQREWADQKVKLTWEYHSENETLTEFRRRVYGNQSSLEIVYPSRGQKKFDLSTAVPAEKSDAIDLRYRAALDQIGANSDWSRIAIGLFAWLVPLIAAYLAGFAGHWVYAGFQSREIKKDA